MIKIAIIKKSEHIERLHEVIRLLDVSDLSEERRKILTEEKDRLENYLKDFRAQEIEKEGVKMEEINEQVKVEEKPKKKKLIREQVADIETQAYDSLKELTSDAKVLVSLTQKLLSRFREEKKADNKNEDVVEESNEEDVVEESNEEDVVEESNE